jgi:hypothetical protein
MIIIGWCGMLRLQGRLQCVPVMLKLKICCAAVEEDAAMHQMCAIMYLET